VRHYLDMPEGLKLLLIMQSLGISREEAIALRSLTETETDNSRPKRGSK
jgi:hypothetical protein